MVREKTMIIQFLGAVGCMTVSKYLLSVEEK
jgi:hypothetical protein